MGTKLIDVDHDHGAVAKIIRALHNPVVADPGAPVNGELWYNITSDQWKIKKASGVQVLATMADVTGGAISGTLWDAQSVVVAVADNTPVAQVLAASTVLGRRAAGDIGAVSYVNLLADLVALGVNASTLGGSNLAAVLNRANHTGTQASTTISDFTTAVNTLVAAGINNLVGAAPGTLDTLNELAAALGNDPNFATTITTSLGLKTEIFSSNFGNGVAQAFPFAHGFATNILEIQTYRNSDNSQIECGVVITDANTVTVTTVTVPANNAYRVHIIGRNL
jgi:hypothetical protein